MAGIKITGIGGSKGEKVVTNLDFAETVDTSDEWIRSKTGIVSRYFAGERSNADMACEAAERALKDGEVGPDEIGLLIVCTFTPDDRTPGVACEVAGRLSLSESVLCLDVNGACSGFIYGCILADGFLKSRAGAPSSKSPKPSKALVIGSEKISPLLDMNDRTTCVLFGDGAGAVVLEYDEEAEFHSVYGCMPDREVLGCGQGDESIHMAGQEVYRFAVAKSSEATRTLMEESRISDADVDYFVFHQANERIIASSISRLKFPEEKFFVDVSEYGNTSAASVPLAMADMREKGLLRNGLRLVCTGFGAGLTYGSMYIRFGR